MTHSTQRRAGSELGALIRLAGPLIANNLATVGMGFVDTVMAGRLSASDLAAVGLGSAVWTMCFLFGLGTLMALNPITSHIMGSGTPAHVGRYLRQGLWLSQALAVVVFVLLGRSVSFLSLVGADPQIVPLTGGYLRAISFGLPLAFAYLCLRFISEGLGHTRPIMYMGLLGLAVNTAGNYVLMFGKLGFPALGAVGCGAATAIAFACMCFGMLWYVRRHVIYRALALFRRFDWPSARLLREISGLGLPIGTSVLAEAGLFSCVGILMATLGAPVVAAHQIALNYAATMFMLPLAVHSATTVRVGQARGAGDALAARFRGIVGMALCTGIMTISALGMLLFSSYIVGFYTSDPEVARIAISLLGMAAIFQISDGLQVGAAGALRGLKDARTPMLINLFAYWAIGFPTAYLLGIALELGPRWVWFGFVAGLSVAALMLTARFLRISAVAVAAAPAGRSE